MAPKDFESQTHEINKLISLANTSSKLNPQGGIFGPIEEIMHMIEDTF